MHLRRACLGTWCLFLIASAAFVTMPSFVHAFPGQCGQSKIDWKEISKAYISYLDDASLVNAKAFVNALPKKRIAQTDKNPVQEFETTLDIIFSAENLRRLMQKIREGDKVAIEAITRIYNFTDAGNAEAVHIILGDAMRDHPRLFLEVMYENMDYQGLDSLVGSAVMTRYTLDSQEEQRELNNRLVALKSVEEVKYKELRDAFILEILKVLKSKSPCNISERS